MRFKFEPCTIEFVQRRAAEESVRNNGKNVTHVYLNRQEWGEFCFDFYEHNKYMWFNYATPPSLETIRIMPQRRLLHSPADLYAPIAITSISVSLDPKL